MVKSIRPNLKLIIFGKDPFSAQFERHCSKLNIPLMIFTMDKVIFGSANSTCIDSSYRDFNPNFVDASTALVFSSIEINAGKEIWEKVLMTSALMVGVIATTLEKQKELRFIENQFLKQIDTKMNVRKIGVGNGDWGPEEVVNSTLQEIFHLYDQI